MEKLTTKQEMILQIIKKWIAKYGYPPTVREIGEEAHLNSPATIHFHLTKLEEKGYITKGNGKNRTIEVLVPNEYLEKDENVVEVPLLGKVTAGNPIEAIEVPDEYFALPTNLFTTRNEIFTLKVSGESMINVGIYDGEKFHALGLGDGRVCHGPLPEHVPGFAVGSDTHPDMQLRIFAFEMSAHRGRAALGEVDIVPPVSFRG